MDVVLVMFKDDEKREFPLSKQKTIIGRRPDCDLRIPTSDVSRRHCEIGPGAKRGELVVRDLGSSNGTFVNDKRVAEAKLEAGDLLTVGPVAFVVQIDGKPAEVAKPDEGATTGAKGVMPVPADGVDTDDILDLGDIDFEFDDPTSAIEAMLDDDDDDDEDKRS